MYGYTPRAATLRLRSAPPEKRSRKPRSGFAVERGRQRVPVHSRHRHVCRESEDHQHGEREEDPESKVRDPHRVDYGLQEGRAGRFRALGVRLANHQLAVFPGFTLGFILRRRLLASRFLCAPRPGMRAV